MKQVLLDLFHLYPQRALGQESAAQSLIYGFSKLRETGQLHFNLVLGLSVEMQSSDFKTLGFEVSKVRISSQSPFGRVVAQRALKSDLVFGLGNSVGLWSGLKRGCTIHDLHHRHYPEQYSRLKTLFYKSLAERSWSRSSVRVVPSHFVARELKEFCGLDSRVIPWSPEPCGVGEETAKPKEQKEQKEISREAFFLSVSSGAPHKRVPEMLQAYAAYRKRHGEMKWVHVGPRLKEFEKVVEFVDHCDAQKLRDLYSRAAAYVSASEFEGFGLPVSESLYFGTPVILSQMASHPELTRESEVLWVPREKPGLWTPKDHASWIDAFFGASKLKALPKKSGIHGTRVWMDVAAEYQKAWLEVLG